MKQVEARPRRRRPHVHRSGALSRCAARDRRRIRVRTSMPSASKRSVETNASDATRPSCESAAFSTTSASRKFAPRQSRRCARESPRPKRRRLQIHGSSSSMRMPTRRLRSRRSSTSRCVVAELTLVEAVNDALHTELARDDSVLVLGEDVGRAGGVFRATAGLRDRLRRRSLRRHAACRGGHARRGRRALHGRAPAGVRDAVRRLLLPLSRPADHPRGPLPLAYTRREMDFPVSDSNRRTAAACERRSCTTTRPRPTTCTHPGPLQGRDSFDARRREKVCSPRRSATPIRS